MKNINFILGFVIGIILTFGRAYFPMVEKVLSPIFVFWTHVWPIGLILEVFPLYITAFIIFLIIWAVFLKNKESNGLAHSIKLFSLGFVCSFILFLVVTFLAISQFKFAQ
jgi:hypothetical protein